MKTLIIGNSRTEEMVGQLATLTHEERRSGGSAAMRLLAFATAGDVVVLPYPPAADYFDYLTALTGVDPDTLLVLCPPPGVLGAELLTADRMADQGFREQVRTAVRERGIDRLMAVYKDVSLTQFATAGGLRVPGHSFSAQGGDALINSKAGFRAIAAGTATPIAPGLTTTQRFEAQAMVDQLFVGRAARDGQAGVLWRRARQRDPQPSRRRASGRRAQDGATARQIRSRRLLRPALVQADRRRSTSGGGGAVPDTMRHPLCRVPDHR